ncbi:hypothetical protein QBC37DRAFT_71809 [Rhypophila decipiens]|uniref:Uncharacterized protein n=1 Tax=Rhypophila decipiens TaxID=261697 RepID=A0AAN6YIM6_9PEZI|nr:hypothetical protein QBC37DRAFT_71809 [Rhypophila decipiens]
MRSCLSLPLSVACLAAAWVPTVQSTDQQWAHKNTTPMQNMVVDLGMDKFTASGSECKLQDFSNEPALSFSKIQGNQTYLAAALSFVVDTPAHSKSFKPEKLLEGSSAYLSYLQTSMHSNGSGNMLSSEKEALVPFRLPEASCGQNIVFIAFVSVQPPTLKVDDSYTKQFAAMKKDASKRKDCKFKEFWKSAALGEITGATWINIAANNKAECSNGGGAKTKPTGKGVQTTTIVTTIKGKPTTITTTVPAETPAAPKNGTRNGAGTTKKEEAVTTITTTVNGKPTTITTKVPSAPSGHTKEAQGPAKSGYDVVASTITTTVDGKPKTITTTVPAVPTKIAGGNGKNETYIGGGKEGATNGKNKQNVVTTVIITTKEGKPTVITTTVSTTGAATAPSSAPQRPGDYVAGGGAKTNGTVTPGKDDKGNKDGTEKQKQKDGKDKNGGKGATEQPANCTTAAITSTITTTVISGTKTITSTTLTTIVPTITNPASAVHGGGGKGTPGEGEVVILPYPSPGKNATQKTTTMSSESFITSEKTTTATTTDAKGSPTMTVVTTTVTATVLNLQAPGEQVVGGPDEGYVGGGDGQRTSGSPSLPTGSGQQTSASPPLPTGYGSSNGSALSSSLLPFNNTTTTTRGNGNGNVADPTGTGTLAVPSAGAPSAGGPSAGAPSAGSPSAGSPSAGPSTPVEAGAPAVNAEPAVMAALLLGGLGGVFFAIM